MPTQELDALAKGPISAGWSVTRVVDGDTVDVTRSRRTLTLRLIGIDTPETVHPTVPVECFGPEASKFAKRQLLGQKVTLEFDRSQGRLDYYGRTLAYLWLVGGQDARMFNRAAIAKGFAEEYTYDSPYAWRPYFQAVEARAVAQGRGLWQACR